MIKVNLLSADRRRVPRKRSAIPVGQKLTVSCSLILLSAALLIGWRYRTISGQSRQLDQEIETAQKETTRLHSIIGQVQQFEQRRAQLQQRVALIEQLRKGQTGPVHMLDEISRAMPSTLWLTELRETPTANEVLIEGRCLTLTALSDFVTSLEGSGYFKKSVDIVSSQTEPLQTPPGEVVKFQVRAQFEGGS